MSFQFTDNFSIGFRRFGKPDQTVARLSGPVSLVPTGRPSITVITGPCGIGKSTLLKTLAGALPPLQGTARFLDRDIPTSILFGKTYFSPDSIEPPAHLTAKQILISLSHSRTHVLGYAKLLDINPKTPWVDLSLGNKGKVRLALALAHASASEESLVLLDEPFAAIDAETVRLVLTEFDNLFASPSRRLLVTLHSTMVARPWWDSHLHFEKSSEGAVFGIAKSNIAAAVAPNELIPS